MGKIAGALELFRDPVIKSFWTSMITRAVFLCSLLENYALVSMSRFLTLRFVKLTGTACAKLVKPSRQNTLDNHIFMIFAII